MLLQVYYGQADAGNTLPYLVGCVFIYFAYRWIKSVVDQPAKQSVKGSGFVAPANDAARTIADAAVKADAMYGNNVKKAAVEQKGQSQSNPSTDPLNETGEAKKQAFDEVATQVFSNFSTKTTLVNEESEGTDNKVTLEGVPLKEVQNEDLSATIKATITKLQRNPKSTNQTIVTTSAGHTLWLEESYLREILFDVFKQDLRPTVLMGSEIFYEMKSHKSGSHAFDSEDKPAFDSDMNPIIHKTNGETAIILRFGKIVGNFTALDNAIIEAKENAEFTVFGIKPTVKNVQQKESFEAGDEVVIEI